MVRAPRRGLIDGDREFGIPDFDRFPGMSRRNAAARQQPALFGRLFRATV
ncbi:hypothetical protein [Methylorubrum extorquens]|nr:hypothetical protein [Methylorubrum extorquens]MCP1549595.1 hypothetical protein [Methylorubrum zatmanii]MCP1579897.1 hypothetical protein [Methylorubrum extorquens]